MKKTTKQIQIVFWTKHIKLITKDNTLLDLTPVGALEIINNSYNKDVIELKINQIPNLAMPSQLMEILKKENKTKQNML